MLIRIQHQWAKALCMIILIDSIILDASRLDSSTRELRQIFDGFYYSYAFYYQVDLQSKL